MFQKKNHTFKASDFSKGSLVAICNVSNPHRNYGSSLVELLIQLPANGLEKQQRITGQSEIRNAN